MARVSTANWAEIERQYRDGVMSIRVIAEQHRISDTAIRKRATAEKWIRSEGAQVRAMAERIVAERRASVYEEPGQERVEVLAKVGADILEAHQRRFAQMQRIVDKQIDELEQAGDQQPVLEASIEDYFLLKAAGDPTQAGVHRMHMQRALHAVRLPSRAKVLVDLVGAASKLSDMERRAFNLDEQSDARSYEDILAELHAKKDAA